MQQQTLEALATCVGKARFTSWSLARRVVERRRRHRKDRSARNIYRCSCCGGWHIGELS